MLERANDRPVERNRFAHRIDLITDLAPKKRLICLCDDPGKLCMGVAKVRDSRAPRP
ncbi:MAG TPA: hypothetical protein VFV78_01620 [Vicinamibacterales bacterium]|nr:hypothetical protein [Vicinamibacterales bacterium]